MNLAFQALAVFILSLPGLILRYTYRKGFWPRPVGLRPVAEEIAYSIVLACCLHAAYGGIIHRYFQQIDLVAVGYILAGNFGHEEEHLARSLGAVTGFPYHVLSYFVILYILSAGIGLLGHLSVRRLKLDRRIPLLRFANDWHYLLRGEILDFADTSQQPMDVKAVLVTAVIDVGEHTYLYVGILQDFYFDSLGNLDRIVLEAVHRRILSDDAAKEQPPLPYYEREHYYYIEANYLVLKYSEIKNLGVWYLTSDPSEPELLETEENSAQA